MANNTEHEFIDSEKESLEVHVQNCVRRQTELRKDIREVRRLIIGLICVLLGGGYVTVEQVLPKVVSMAVAAASK